jgi:predicted RNase H-like nuclease
VSGRLRVAGVDGWRGRWVIAGVEATTGRVEWALANDAAEVVERTADCAAVAVDVPMGLSQGPGGRECDALARKALPGAASSVFPAPLRPTLDATTHAEAVKIAHALGGGAPSIQAWNITPGIRQWDDVLGANLEVQRRIVESHPEVSFRRLGGAARWARKSTAHGVAQRVSVLRPWVDAMAALGTVPDGPGIDDALDALVCAWSAWRYAVGRADTLPLSPPADARGLLMRIVV